MGPELARKMWRTLEPIHGMIYFVPEAPAAYEEAGIDDVRAGYFASRAAPMGAVNADVVIATFFNFYPDLVRRAVPRCWSLVPPERMVAARFSAVDAALRRMLDVSGEAVAEAANLTRIAATAPTLSPSGRPLYAGHAALPWPSEPHLALWHAISVLREYRGDGHIAAMTAEGVDGPSALVIHGATGDVPPAVLRATREWPADEWAAAADRLRERGWLDASGALTEEGRAHRSRVEEATDRLALAPWEHLGPERCERLREIARPLSRAIVDAGTFPTR